MLSVLKMLILHHLEWNHLKRQTLIARIELAVAVVLVVAQAVTIAAVQMLVIIPVPKRVARVVSPVTAEAVLQDQGTAVAAVAVFIATAVQTVQAQAVEAGV